LLWVRIGSVSGGACPNNRREISVDVFKALRALYEERRKLDDVIDALEDLQKKAAEAGGVAELSLQERRGRRAMDEEARRQVSERMRSYWARRKEEQTVSKR
jgi:hypothetical protein